jgi:hypothetical protein
MIHRVNYMINKLIPIVACAILSIGCFAQNRKMLIDYQFNAQENKLIDRAIWEWHGATGSPDAIIFVYHGAEFAHDFTLRDWLILDSYARMYKINRASPGYDDLAKKIPSDDGSYGDFMGLTSRGRVILMVNDYYYNSSSEFFNEVFYSTILHEFGHFFGIGHLEHGIMSQPEIPICIDIAAVNRFCNLYPTCHNPHSTCKDGK